MSYYKRHKKMSALQMPYYEHHRKLHNFHYMYTAVHSQFSGKVIKEQILKMSLNPYTKEIINYYIQRPVFFTISHFVTSNLEWRMLLKYQSLYTFNMQLFRSGKRNVFWNFSSQNEANKWFTHFFSTERHQLTAHKADSCFYRLLSL